MNKEIKIRHKNIDLVWCGWPNLYKEGDWRPLKLCYNGTVGWWISRKIFVSFNQVKKMF
jgi:hypothetical protein